MGKKIREWIETRIGLEDLIKTQLKEYRVPGNINILYTLGFVAMAAFVVQVITGFFLLIYYIPHPEYAFQTVQDIMNKVPYGWLFRMIHAVGSNLMVAIVILHMFSVLFMGSYKKPREMTWMIGSFMLIMTFLFCLSGYLLPWSQLSYWATTIVTTMPTAFPYIGGFIARLLRGSENVSGVTLNRFFAVHVTFLPLLFIAFLGIHLFLIRRTGISTPPFGDSGEEKRPWIKYRHDSHPQGYPFYPYFLQKEMFMVMFFFALIFFIIGFAPTLFLPEDANSPADPFKTPAHIKPEWYFLAFYQMLKIIPNKLVGISMQGILILIFILWPFLDTKEEENILKRPFLLIVFIGALLVWLALTIRGKYS